MVRMANGGHNLRNDLTDIARIAFMFNGGQSPGSILRFAQKIA